MRDDVGAPGGQFLDPQHPIFRCDTLVIRSDETLSADAALLGARETVFIILRDNPRSRFGSVARPRFRWGLSRVCDRRPQVAGQQKLNPIMALEACDATLRFYSHLDDGLSEPVSTSVAAATALGYPIHSVLITSKGRA